MGMPGLDLEIFLLEIFTVTFTSKVCKMFYFYLIQGYIIHELCSLHAKLQICMHCCFHIKWNWMRGKSVQNTETCLQTARAIRLDGKGKTVPQQKSSL